MNKHITTEPPASTGYTANSAALSWCRIKDTPDNLYRYVNATTHETVDVTANELARFQATSATWRDDFWTWLEELASSRPEPAPIPHAIEGPGGTWKGIPSNTKGVCQFQCEETGQIVSVSEKEYSDFESRFPPHSATRVFNLHNWLMSKAEGASLGQ